MLCGVRLGARSPGGSAGAESLFQTTRSTPVPTWVVWVAVLLVSSASKWALFGSTVTVLVIGPVVGGATRSSLICFVDSAGIVPPLQVTTLEPSTAQPKPPSVL